MSNLSGKSDSEVPRAGTWWSSGEIDGEVPISTGVRVMPSLQNSAGSTVARCRRWPRAGSAAMCWEAALDTTVISKGKGVGEREGQGEDMQRWRELRRDRIP